MNLCSRFLMRTFVPALLPTLPHAPRCAEAWGFILMLGGKGMPPWPALSLRTGVSEPRQPPAGRGVPTFSQDVFGFQTSSGCSEKRPGWPACSSNSKTIQQRENLRPLCPLLLGFRHILSLNCPHWSEARSGRCHSSSCRDGLLGWQTGT